MLNLLNFFEGEDANPSGSWITWVILGVLLVGMILLMIIPQRRQKKRAEEMMSKLAVGSIVTTIGGIVGEVIELDDKHIWLRTGNSESQTVMQFVRQAIHSIAPAPGSAEYEEAQKKAEEQQKADEVDEIK